jgi:menaquinone-dependent protoporphyrinogen oxidase
VIVGASVHVGGYQRALKKWVKTHSADLNSIPNAFMTICLGVLQNDREVKLVLKRIVDDLVKSSGWRPKTRVTFAGAMAYSKYGFLLKWWMRRIAKKAGGDTDASKDYEYTNWKDVSEFARNFSHRLANNVSIVDRKRIRKLASH